MYVRGNRKQHGKPLLARTAARSSTGTLLDSYVRYEVTEDGWALRTATPAKVDAHYEVSRPAHTQTPECDLSVTGIIPLSQIGFDDRRGNRRRRFVSRTSQKTSVTRVSPRVRG